MFVAVEEVTLARLQEVARAWGVKRWDQTTRNRLKRDIATAYEREAAEEDRRRRMGARGTKPAA